MMDLMRINSLVGGDDSGFYNICHSKGNPMIMGLVNDTRKDCQQKMYVAIEGPNYDGHQYVQEAYEKGALAVLAQKETVQKSKDTAVPTVRVADSVRAMGNIAEAWRKDFDIPVLGITGSAGKTTLKELAGSVLSQSRQGIITEGNLNNEIGVPLTLTRIGSEDEYAVVEMGMNHAGEIEYLSNMSSPTVAIINNAAPAHLDDLGSVESVARAKGEIISGLRSDGVLIINADDRYCSLWKGLAGSKRVVTFGLSDDADITASYEMTALGAVMDVDGKYGQFTVQLTLTGEHNVRNALAVTAATLEMGCSIQDVKQGLFKYKPMANRGGIHRFEHAMVIDDTYNANPVSMQAAFEVLALQIDLARKSHSRINTSIVLGSMGELGKFSGGLHQQVGSSAKRVADSFYCCGERQQDYCQGFGERAIGFEQVESLIVGLKEELNLGHSRGGNSDQFQLILVKGSRSEGMEKVVTELLKALHSEELNIQKSRESQEGN